MFEISSAAAEWLMPARPATEREIIWPDERVRVRDTLQVPFRWVCSLDITRGSTLSRGSGLLVGPRQVLTAAHNIYDASGNRPDSVWVAPARNGSDFPFGRFRAVAFTTTSRYLTAPRPGSRFDFALVTLDRDASAVRSRAPGGAPLGFWGSPTAGAQTELRALDPRFLAGKEVTLCGYPGDKCDGGACDPSKGWTRDMQANTMWTHFGTVSFTAAIPGIILYRADTARGQSGSPVWIRFTNGRRVLVGVHVDAHRVQDATTGAVTVSANRGVFLDRDALALVRSWMGG